MRKIVVVEPGSSVLYIINAVKLLGFEPVILCAINEYDGEHKKYLYDHGFLEVDASDVDNIIKCLKENEVQDIEGVISTADRFITQAYKVGVALGVKTMDPALLKVNSKAEVVALIKEHSPPTIIFEKEAIPYDELKRLLKKANSLIFKPEKSAGAKGLFEAASDKDIDNLYELMQKEKQVKVLNQRWLAQPSIVGTLYSLEGFVLNDQIYHIGVSRRVRIKYTESQNWFPVDDEISLITLSALKKAHADLVAASGYKNGYYHTEIIFDGKSAFLIDANFGRIGGACIAEQVARSSGKKIEEIYAHVIGVSLFFDKPGLENFYLKERIKMLSILYSAEKKAKFLEVELPKNMQCSHVCLAHPGKQLKPAGQDNRSWIGILTGLPKQVEKEINEISIVTDIGKLKPVF